LRPGKREKSDSDGSKAPQNDCPIPT
jgi:hypothetical protein